MKVFTTKALSGVLAITLMLTLGACSSDARSSNAEVSNTDGAAADTIVDQPAATRAGEADLTGIIPTGSPVELTVYSQLANFSGEQLGWSAEILKDKFNVKWNIVNDAIQGTFATRMASGNLGDIIFFGGNASQYQQAADGNMLYDWNEDNLVQDYAPYIWANMQPALKNNIDKNGGTLYGVGDNVASSAQSHGTYIYYPDIRFDLYQKTGSPQLNTMEDYIPLLEQMQKLEPTTPDGSKTYGVSLFPDWDGDMIMEVKATAALYGWDEFGFGLYHPLTQTYDDCLNPNGMYIRCLKFYNTLFQKGLLDPDSMTQDFNTMYAKYVNGQAFFNIFQWIGDAYNSDTNKGDGKYMAAVAAKDLKNIVYGLNILGQNYTCAIGAKTNYPELCISILNWLSTSDGVLEYNYGPKGLMWDYDANGHTYLTDLGIAAQADQSGTQMTYGSYTGSYKDGQFQHNFNMRNIDSVNPDSALGETYDQKFWASSLAAKTYTPIEQQWQEFAGGAQTPDEYLEGNGHITLSVGTPFIFNMQDPLDNALDTTWEQVKQCIVSGSWNAIYAKSDSEFDSIVAKMTSDAKSYGYDDCVKWCQAQAALRKAAEDSVKAQ